MAATAGMGYHYPPPPAGPPPPLYSPSSTYLPYAPSPAGPQQLPPRTQSQPQSQQQSRGLSSSYYSNHPHASQQQQQQQQQQVALSRPQPAHRSSPQDQGRQRQRPHSVSPRPISRGQRLGAAAAGAVATTVLDKYLIEPHTGHRHHHHRRSSSAHRGNDSSGSGGGGGHHTIRRIADVAIGSYAGVEALKQYEKRKGSGPSSRRGSGAGREDEYYGESHNDLLHPRGRAREQQQQQQYLLAPPSPYGAPYRHGGAEESHGRHRARSYDDGLGRSRSRDASAGGGGGGGGSHLKRDLAQAAIAALVGQQAGRLAHHGRDRSPGKHAAEGALAYGVAKELLGRRRK